MIVILPRLFYIAIQYIQQLIHRQKAFLLNQKSLIFRNSPTGRLRKYRILPRVEFFKKPGFSRSWFLQTTEKIDRSFSAVLSGVQLMRCGLLSLRLLVSQRCPISATTHFLAVERMRQVHEQRGAQQPSSLQISSAEHIQTRDSFHFRNIVMPRRVRKQQQIF